MTEPSHRLKLYRADAHRRELESLLGDSRKRREYAVAENMIPGAEGAEWVYNLNLAAASLDEMFPIVLGDFLFNVRSALDHLAVSLVPRKLRRQASFPIWSRDPLRTKQGGDYEDPVAAKTWLTLRDAVPDQCARAFLLLQPFEVVRHHPGARAQDHPLAILSTLQNLDKHRALITVVTGLANAVLDVDGKPEEVKAVLNDGATLVREHERVAVTIAGAALVGVRRRVDTPLTWPLDEFLENLVRFTANEVLPALEPFVRE